MNHRSNTRGSIACAVALSLIVGATGSAQAIEALSASSDITIVSGTGADVLADEDVGRLIVGGGTSAAFLGSLPAGADLSGYAFLPTEEELFALDQATQLPGGLDVDPRDVIGWDGASHWLEFDGSAEGIPVGVAIDGVAKGSELYLSFDTTVALPGGSASTTEGFESLPPGAYTAIPLGAFTGSTGGYAFAVIDAGGGNQVLGDATPTDVFGTGIVIERADGGSFDVVSFDVLDLTGNPVLGTFGDPGLGFAVDGVSHSKYTPPSAIPVTVVPSPAVENVTSISFGFRNFSTVDEFVVDNLVLRIDGELVVADEDLVAWNGSEFSLVLDGSATGLDHGLDIDAVHSLSGAGNAFAVSFDTSGEVDGSTFDDEDLLVWNGSSWQLYFDASAEDASWRPADLDAVFVPEPAFGALLIAGMAGTALLARRRARR